MESCVNVYYWKDQCLTLKGTNWQSLLPGHMQMLRTRPEHGLQLPPPTRLQPEIVCLPVEASSRGWLPPSPELYIVNALRFVVGTVRVVTAHLTPAFLYMCLSFLWSRVTPVKLPVPSCEELRNHQRVNAIYCFFAGILLCWAGHCCGS